ncbi:HNH endonuclease [Pseudomonas putida]|uniref:HNH endonuclease n=1 Tax=Pseudomonas putida TaxID=303 RepID=UPI00178C443D|nr:HNH endonuclease [Pseudomonas putida]
MTDSEHAALREAGAANCRIWGDKQGPHAALIRGFRREVKSYYWQQQSRRCCYCSKELDIHQGSYDAEHIIPKSAFPHLTFELSNLAVTCKTCNTRKQDQSVLVENGEHAEVPLSSNAYVIVHPHIDDWDEFMEHDQFGRISAKSGSPKGSATIRMCGIEFLNAARLADNFHPTHNPLIQKALEFLCSDGTREKKIKHLEFLEMLVNVQKMQAARPILALLRTEVESMPIAAL